MGATVQVATDNGSKGYKGLVTGGSANELTPPVGDANTMIPETKAFLCDVKKA